MKPILLTIAGLHSFREKQEIDFETLCEGGVFGIFGPTGSGKSSILDAMTLALYGKVERASNNTQGIMNHAESVLEVSFVFELENAKGKQRFKVERTFKRSDEIRVKSGISRLSQIQESEHVVLADKAGDVNGAIQEIVGLTIDDFTRAVVLPQGKFAEFLSLKGAERRQMLQRLFQLEKYGDHLSRKIKDDLQTKTRLLGEIQAEQLGLGDASKKAVQEATKAYQEITVNVDVSDKALTELEKLFEESKKKWEWQAEKQKVEESLLKVKNAEPEIKNLEAKLLHAEQAAAIKPILDELSDVEKTLTQWKGKNTEDSKAYAAAKEELQKNVEAYESARKVKEKQHPLLLTKKEQVERALKLEETMEALQQQLFKHNQNLAAKKELLSQLELQEKRTQELYQKALVKQKLLKEELATIALSTERMEQLQQAFDKKQEVEQVEKKLAETNEEEQKLYVKLQQYKKEVLAAEAECKKWQGNLIAFFSKTERHYSKSAELTLQLDWLQLQVEQYLQEEKKKSENKKLHQLALELSKTLKPGEACPVCGSTSHPNGAQSQLDGMEEVAAAHSNEGEKLLVHVQQEKQQNMTVKLKFEQLASELFQEMKGTDLPLTDASTEKVDEWEKEYRGSSDRLELLVKKYHGIETEQKSLRQDLLQIQQKKGELFNSLRKWTSSYNESRKLLQSYEEQWTTWSNRLQSLKQEIEKKQKSFYESFPHESYEEIKKNFLAAKEADKRMRELQERINKSVGFIEEKEQELKNAQNKRIEEEKILFQEQLTHDQVHTRIKEAKEEVNSIAGDQSARELFQQIEKELAQLISYEEKACYAWTSAQNDYHELDKKVKQSEQMVAETSGRYEMFTSKWETALEKSSFSSKEEVNYAISYLINEKEWKANVQQYWEDRNGLQKDWNRLESLIGEQTIDVEQWRELQKRLQEHKQKLREEIEAKSAAFQHLSSIKERHERYRILEDQKETLTVEKERYQKLQAVFKGNSFVEYLAEEQLLQISRDASERLGHLTRQRYALEIDSQGGFIIRDDANGGVRRPVSSLSGGETFLTSLALALSLSAQIQLRGEYPLQFFFLDEGFGTLDQELLDSVVTALEKLQSNHLAVGVISHVQELRARLPRRLVVAPAHSAGKGSVVTLENL